MAEKSIKSNKSKDIDLSSACDILGVRGRMLIVAKKLFKTQETTTLEGWRKRLIAKRIIE